MTFYIKQNDTRPNLAANLFDGDGSIPSVVFKMRKSGSTTATVNSAAVVTNASKGEVTYTWSASDTATVGSYEAEFEVTYSGGGIQTFPNNQYINIEITDDIA